MGILMVFAVNDRNSFYAMENWLKQIKTHAAENVVKVLVANKIDTDRTISEEEGRKMAEQFGVTYYEVSAKDGEGIEGLFHSVGKDVKDKVLSGELSNYVQNRQISKNKI